MKPNRINYDIQNLSVGDCIYQQNLSTATWFVGFRGESRGDEEYKSYETVVARFKITKLHAR